MEHPPGGEPMSAERDQIPAEGRIVEVLEVTHGGEPGIVRVARGTEHGFDSTRYVWLSIEIPDERFMEVRLTEDEWDTIRGAR